MYKPYRYLLLMVSLLSLTACGFQLQTRTSFGSEIQRMHVTIRGPQSEFARHVESLLRQNGVQLVDSGENAAELEVPVNRARKEIQSIGNNARVREYLLRYTVKFRLLDRNGKELIPLQTLEQSRTYSFNEQDILSAEREDEFLRSDLAESLARMLVRRLGSYQKQE
ncbi:MAG: LPS assembly lipoprotein LptE [Lysobacterales bacterium]|jgi:LPS-assembly lipoprotein